MKPKEGSCAAWGTRRCLHVCIDDHSRFCHAAVRDDERRHTAVDFLEQVVAHYRQLGITVEPVMTDNVSCYKSAAFRKACTRLGIKHKFTAPTRPRPTAKLNASSSRPSASGLMPAPTSIPPNAPTPCPSGSNVTTGAAPTDLYKANRPSPGFAWRTTS